MSQSAPGMYKPFVWVLGALVLFTIVIAVLANSYSPKSDPATDPLVQRGLLKQIAPVGQSRVEKTTDDEQQASATPATVAADESETVVEAEVVEPEVGQTPSVEADLPATAGDAVVATDTDAAATVVDVVSPAIPVKVRAVVATNCAGCHEAGVRGAPRNDDVAAWKALAEKGPDALTQSVIAGKGAMLPRAETSLSDEELGLAVRHMLALNVPDAATATVEESVAEGADAAVSATEAADSAAPAAPEVVAEAVDEAPAAVQLADIPDNVKGVVDTVCGSCHISGVANAPKYGDQAAWDKVLSVGMDKVLASAIAGKGLMPPRGGSSLSDAELRLAIEYMATK